MKYLLPFFLFSLVAISCKKNTTTKELTKTEMISFASWKYESGGIDADRNGTIDYNFSSGILPSCVLDNIATFSSNGTGIGDEGATKCNASSPQTTPFAWNFLNSETSITVSGSGLLGIGGEFKIITLSATKFSLSKDTVVTGFPTAISMLVNLQH